jgi:hypothetical protein
MNLADFEGRLAGVLRDADLRTVAVISCTDPDAFAQFMIDEVGTKGTLLITQAGGETLSPDGEAQLQAAGFQLDPVMPTRVWSAESSWPTPSARLRELAHAMVAALEDCGVASPENLTYKAWRDPEPWPAEVTGEELAALDRGQNPLPIPELGLLARG